MRGSFLRRETRDARRGRRQAYLRRMARLLRVSVAGAGRIMKSTDKRNGNYIDDSLTSY